MLNSEISLTPKAKSKSYAKSLSLITGCMLLVIVCGLLHACTSKSSNRPPKFQQYFVQGEQLYLRHCSNCHQKNGKGLGLIYPPLDSSDYMEKNLEDVLCMMRHGRSGVLIVNGESFNQSMPGVPTLSDLEIAEIATYIYNSWSHNKGIVDVKVTSKILSRCDSL